MDDSSFPIPENITRELYKRSAELVITNKIFSLLNKLYEISILTLSPILLAEKITQTLLSELDAEAVGIFLFDAASDEATPLYISFSKRVEQSLGIQQIKILIEKKIPSVSQNDFFSRVLQSDKDNPSYTEVLDDIWGHIFHSEVLVALKEQAHLRSILLYPLRVGENKTIGFLLLGLNHAFTVLSDFEKKSIHNFINVVATALDKALLYYQVKKAHEDLEVAYEGLKKLDNAKTEFLSMASHQLRTPISIIRGNVSMLEEGDYGILTEREMKVIHKTLGNVERLAEIIDDILSVSHIESGKFSINKENLDIVQTLSSAVDQGKQEAERKGISVVFEKKITSISVPHDTKKLFQVFFNLIDNAIKYTKEGSVKVSIDNQENELLISISDTGIGIPEDFKKMIFGKFVRADNAKKIRPDGSGIGLFLVKSIIEGHGGSIEVQSPVVENGEEIQGTKFTVKLPILN